MNSEGDVLLVEDNPRDAELTLRALKGRGISAKVCHVKDGEEALDFIFARALYRERDVLLPPRLVMLDLKLPKIDGLEVLRAIRGDERTRHIPVVVLTSSAEDRDLVEAYSLGVNSFIVKPVEFENFTDAVSQLGLYWLLLNRPPPADTNREGAGQ
jgi:CheY-like chemotaxis protein